MVPEARGNAGRPNCEANGQLFGSPQALGFTLTNVGAIVLPEPANHCSLIYGLMDVQSKIIAGTPEGNGLAMGCAGTCGTDGRRTIVDAIRDSRFHLRPG